MLPAAGVETTKHHSSEEKTLATWNHIEFQNFWTGVVVTVRIDCEVGCQLSHVDFFESELVTI